MIDASGAKVRYRLLETTRAYAREKLVENGEFEQVARAQAELLRHLFERAETEWETRPAVEWLAHHSRRIDDLRAALDWSFSPHGDTSIGVALTVASVALWLQLSLMEECRGRVERAVHGDPGSSGDLRRRMKLYAALGLSLMQTKGPACAGPGRWRSNLREALTTPSISCGRSGGCGCALQQWRGRIRAGVRQEFWKLCRANQPDPVDLLIGDRMTGTPLHYLGDQTNARRQIERMLARYVTPFAGRISSAFNLISG